MADQYYVRVIGSLDNSRPAKVAAPWTPSIRNTDEVALYSPLKCSTHDSPLHGSPRESPITVKAYAGPMSASQVCSFYVVSCASLGFCLTSQLCHGIMA